MDDALDEQAARRARAYGELLLDNAQLRDALNDEQARQVIDWGLGRLGLAAIAAGDAPEADRYMDEQAQAISRILRQVNGLTPTLAYLVEDDMAEELLESFMSSLAELTGYELTGDWFDQAMAQRPLLDEKQTFQLFFDALRAADGAHE